MSSEFKISTSLKPPETVQIASSPQHPPGNPTLEALCTSRGDIPSQDQWNPVEEALYTLHQFSLAESEAAALRSAAIRFSFRYHFEHNPFYRRFCQTSGVQPADLKGPELFHEIPLVPEHIFKGCQGPDQFVSWLASITSDELHWPAAVEFGVSLPL